MASRIVDNLIAYRILTMMITNFEDTKAFKLGIIDKTGKNLKKTSTLKTAEEKDAYTYLTRLVFNMKKIVNKIGGENKLKSFVAALFLVKEYYESGSRTTSLMEEKFERIMKTLDNNVTLVEEEMLVNKFFSEDAVVNVTGAAVSTDQPKIDKKNIKKYQIMAKRKPINVSA
jgi:hypothetical protein